MLRGGGWEQWSKDTLPLPAAEKTEAQMSENKNPPERKGQNLLISHLCTVKHSLWELKCLIGSRHFHHFIHLPWIPGHLLSQLWPWVCRWDETEGLSRFYFLCFAFRLCRNCTLCSYHGIKIKIYWHIATHATMLFVVLFLWALEI